MYAATRTLLTAAAAAVLAATPATSTPPAAAATLTVSPGDAITHISAEGAKRCTLGFVFTTAATTYGVTAGHCRSHSPGHVTDTTTGATGRFLRSRYNTDVRHGADYGLIDFGAATAQSDILGMPVRGSGEPDDATTICHTGISSGIHCGQLHRRLGAQYTTTGMPRSIPGDSGGPVWTLRDGGAVIVGIWLGEHTAADGTSYGRFHALSTALAGLGTN